MRYSNEARSEGLSVSNHGTLEILHYTPGAALDNFLSNQGEGN